jgi:ABC-type molybdenum transport system ATPase subunit/photorepair protein PhrA
MRLRSGILARAVWFRPSLRRENTIIEIENPQLKIDGKNILKGLNPVMNTCDAHAITGSNGSAHVDAWRRRS